MTRVVHIITGLGVGGAETALFRLVQYVHPGIDHTLVIALTPKGAQVQKFCDIGVPVLELDLKRRPVWSLRSLLRTLHHIRPEVVQTWMYHADLVGGVAARITGCRIVIWGIRATYLAPSAPWTTKAIRRVCAFLSFLVPRFIVCVAEASRQSHIDLGYDASRMRVVSNGYAFDQLQANPEARDRLRQDWGLEPDIFAVGLVGRFNPAKDHQTFVEAAGKVAQFHTTARFILIGRGIEPSNGELMTWIRATGYVDRFLLLGERADVPDCLAAMDGFCLSSRTEGFPNVVAEAMAMALPCVVTDVGDAAYLLGGHGWVVPKEDPWALSAALAALIRLGPEERIRLGRAARTRVRETFTVSQMAEQFANIYSCVP